MSWKRVTLCVCAVLAPLWLPWWLALMLGVIAALFVPPIAVAVGVVFDLLYYPGFGIPYCTMASLLVATTAYFVHQFVKTRIIA